MNTTTELTAAMVATKIDGLEANYTEAADTIWMLLAAMLVFFMHAGFSFLEAGCVRIKNTQNILTKNLLVVTIGFLCWWVFGWGFAYGVPEQGLNEFIGHAEFFNANFFEDKTRFRNWFFQGAFCATAGTIVSGAMAERTQLKGFGILVVVLTSLIYPIVVYWGWSGQGFLVHPKESNPDESESIAGAAYMDFAGSGLVHMVGGVGAICGAIVVGPRKGRFEEPDEDFFPHSIPFVVLGTFFLWFGWYGFNPGSTLAMSSQEAAFTAGVVAVNTTLAPCAAGLVVLFLRAFFLPPRALDVGGMCNGILAGLVAITAGCAFVEPWESVIIGFIGGLVYSAASIVVSSLKIDDVVDAFAVHGCTGFWGVVAVGLFGNPDEGLGGNGILYGGDQLGVQIVAGVFITVFVGVCCLAVLVPLRILGLLRASDEFQEQGADLAEHSPIRAYTQAYTQQKDTA